jgi:4-hydroxy-3-polyprenylbenzoate decarboxylase
MGLQDWVNYLDKEEELKIIDQEVDWYLEAPAINGMNQRVSQGKHALWFRNIKGYPKGMSLLGSSIVGPRERMWKRVSMMLGMPKDTSHEDFRDELVRRLDHPIKPMVVASGEADVKEVIQVGEDVNIYDLPVPYIHGYDGGRYFTFGFEADRDEDTGWMNWGNYRKMLVRKNLLTGLYQMGQHGPTIFYTKYEPFGKNMPFAYVGGGDPCVFVATALPIPGGWSEVDYAGGLLQEPIRVVRCETNDLLVPADAEFVLEGEVLAGTRMDEGPFGEYPGFLMGRYPQPVFRVNCITRRKEVVFPFVTEGQQVTDSSAASCATIPAGIYLSAVGEMNWPVRNVYAYPDANWSNVLASTEVPYDGYISELWGFMQTHKGAVWAVSCYLHDYEVDITDMDLVLEDIGTKLDPENKIIITDEDTVTTPLCMNVRMDERLQGTGACRVLYDHTTPLGLSEEEMPPKAVRFEEAYPDEIKDKVLKNWTKLGLEGEPELKRVFRKEG